MKTLLLVSALLALSSTGCSVVSVTQPIGEKPHAITAADWEGIWIIDGEVAKVKVVDASSGQLRLDRLEEKDGKTVLVTGTIFLSEGGGSVFANLREDSANTEANSYVWAQIRHDGDVALVWSPSPERFVKLIGNGKLPGTIDGDSVRLAPLTPVQLRAMTSGELGPIWEEKSPAVLRRVSR